MSEQAPAFLPDQTTCERLHLITLNPAPEPAPAKPVCVKALLWPADRQYSTYRHLFTAAEGEAHDERRRNCAVAMPECVVLAHCPPAGRKTNGTHCIFVRVKNYHFFKKKK